jgi:RNA polymerase sigma-70 factor (ECF subfamily)
VSSEYCWPDATATEMPMEGRDVPAGSSSSRKCKTDAELTTRFEREALPLLDPLYRGALVLTGDRSEAEDLLEGTMMNAYRRFGLLPASTNLRTSLYRALTNAYISSCGTGHRPPDTTNGRQLPAAAASASTGLTVAQVEALEALPAAVISKALRTLDRDMRMAVYYADVEGFSHKEIADITDRSVSAVTSLVRGGRLQLRDVMLKALQEREACQFRMDVLKDTALDDACAGQLDWFDRDILCFVLLWAPHSEMWDEDVYPRFGMTVEQLVERFHRVIDTSVPRLGRLAKRDRELLDRARHLPTIIWQAR